MRGGVNPLVVGALTAGGVLPLAVLALGAPLWGGLLAAIGAGAGAGALAGFGGHKRASFAAPLMGGASAGVRAALADAEPALARIETAWPQLRHGAVRDRARLMAASGRALVAHVREEQGLLATAQRALTYYLPRAADLVDHYRELEEEGGLDQVRMAALERIVAQLEAALALGLETLRAEDRRALDAEIALVEEALREDFGSRGR